jgi:hypothetical protein
VRSKFRDGLNLNGLALEQRAFPEVDLEDTRDERGLVKSYPLELNIDATVERLFFLVGKLFLVSLGFVHFLVKFGVLKEADNACKREDEMTLEWKGESWILLSLLPPLSSCLISSARVEMSIAPCKNPCTQGDTPPAAPGKLNTLKQHLKLGQLVGVFQGKRWEIPKAAWLQRSFVLLPSPLTRSEQAAGPIRLNNKVAVPLTSTRRSLPLPLPTSVAVAVSLPLPSVTHSTLSTPSTMPQVQHVILFSSRSRN